MSDFEHLLSRYDYPLLPERIAQEPIEPRDTSKLLIYDREVNTIKEDIFAHVAQYLPTNALLVFNNTKVVPARLPGHISTGGRVELLLTRFEGKHIKALCERSLKIGERIKITDKIFAEVLEKNTSEYSLSLEGVEDIRPHLYDLGTTPLPPYLKHSPLSEKERREKYQAIFAKHDGSIAAPTASLHFTDHVMHSLEERGVEVRYVTLHVNLGTFMPLTEEMIQKNELHEEHFEVSEETRNAVIAAKNAGRPVIAVGTTALRALESAFTNRESSTKLFIRDGYEFKAVSGLITNFHVPKSSLMMLVGALVGREKLLELYGYALEHDFRFLSFGDAMLVARTTSITTLLSKNLGVMEFF